MSTDALKIAFVPARGGSKSIPKKNIKMLGGKPLIYWVLHALEKSSVNKIVLATDSDEIMSVARNFNFSKLDYFERSPENAQDSSSTESVILEFINKTSIPLEANFLLVQPTSPLITSNHIDEALSQYASSDADSLVSCNRLKKFIWSPNGHPCNYDPKQRPRRQDFDGILVENGALYISRVSNIISSECRISGKITIYEMPEVNSIDLDEPLDWLVAEQIIRNRNLVHTGSNPQNEATAKKSEGLLDLIQDWPFPI